VTDWQTLQLKI